MTRNELVATLLADGWEQIDPSELTRDGSAILLHSDGSSVAISHVSAYPVALATTADNALLWARNDPRFSLSLCTHVRLS